MSANIPRPFAPAGLKPETLLVHGGTQRSRSANRLRRCFSRRASLRHDGGGGGPLQRDGSRIYLFAVLEPHRRDVRAAHGAAGRRPGGPRDRERHGRGDGDDDGTGQGRRPCRAAKALFGSCRYIVEDLLPRFGVASTLVDGCDSRGMARGDPAQHQGAFPGEPDEPDLDIIDIDAVADIARAGRGQAGRGQRVGHSHAAEPAASSAPTRRLFRDQAYRRTGTLPGRSHPGIRAVHRRSRPQSPAPDGPCHLAVQRMGVAKGSGDPVDACRAPDAGRPKDRRLHGSAPRRHPRALSWQSGPPAGTISLAAR